MADNQNLNMLTSKRLELMITIVPRNKADFFMDLIQNFEVNMQFAVSGEGTAPIEVVNILGLADAEKAVIFSVIREDNVKRALETIEDKFNSLKNCRGIAFTVSFSSVIGASIFNFLSNNSLGIGEGM